MVDKKSLIRIDVINTPKRPMSDGKGCDNISESKEK